MNSHQQVIARLTGHVRRIYIKRYDFYRSQVRKHRGISRMRAMYRRRSR